MKLVNFLAENLVGGDVSEATARAVSRASQVGAVVETTDGWPYLVVDRGTAVPLDAPLAYSTLDQLGADRSTQVILFGLGLGHAARALRGAGLRIAFIFEPEVGVLRQYFERGPSDLEGTKIITDLDELDSEWQRLVGDSSRIQLVDTPGYATAFPEARAALAARITRLLERTLVNDHTYRARGRAWILDIIDNSPHMVGVPSALNLQGAFAGVPAFIVGAGPSLAKNIEHLKAASERGIVFCVNTAAKALARAGIEPQVVGCLESIDVSSHLEGIPFMDRAARVFSLTSHPHNFQVGRGPLLPVYELLPQISGPFEQLYRRPALPVCASVSTALFALAQRMGCNPIVLVGQDLAFSGNQVYASGTPYDGSRIQVDPSGESFRFTWSAAMRSIPRDGGGMLQESGMVEQARAWGGEGFVVSTMAFAQVRLWLERVAQLLPRTEHPPRLVNATEGGASIAGFQEMSLEALIHELELKAVTPQDILSRAFAGGRVLEAADVEAFLQAQALGAKAVEQAAIALEEAVEWAKGVWETADAGVLSECFRKIHSAEQDLKVSVARAPWVDAWAWQAVDRALQSSPVVRGIPEGLANILREAELARAIRGSAVELAEVLAERSQSISMSRRPQA